MLVLPISRSTPTAATRDPASTTTAVHRRWPASPEVARRTAAASGAKGTIEPWTTTESPPAERTTSPGASASVWPDGVEGDRHRQTAGLDDDGRDGRHRERNAHVDRRPAAGLARERHVSLQLGDRVAEHVEADAASRDLGHFGGRRHAALEDQAEHVFGAHVGGGDASRDRRAPDGVHVDSAPVVAAHERDAVAPALHVDLHLARRRLPAATRADRLGLDAVGDGVPHDVEQPVAEGQQHGRLEALLAPRGLEADGSVQRLGGVPHRALEGGEHRARGEEPELACAVPDLRRLALGLLEARRQAALGPREGTRELLGDGLRTGPALRQVHEGPREAAAAGEVVHVSPDRPEVDMTLEDAREERVHLGDLDAYARQRLVGARRLRRLLGWRRGLTRRRRSVEARDERGHFVEQREDPIDAGAAHGGGALLPVRSEHVLEGVGSLRDGRLPDDASGAFQRVRQPKHVDDELRARASLLQLEGSLAEAVQELARLDPEILVLVSRHRLAR